MSTQQEKSDTGSVSSSESCEQAESEPNHTPGPWHVPGQPWYDGNRSAVFSEPDPNAGKLICANQHAEFNPEQYEDGEVRANARLIAAAPALLRACKAVLNCDMVADENGDAFLKVPARSLNDLGAQIRALVDQAEAEI